MPHNQMSTEDDKDQALASLVFLLETCKSALLSMATFTFDTSNIESATVEVLRKDAISLHRLIHTSTTRLSVSLGKPPASYPLAQVPLKDLAAQVAQLTSCTCSFPRGALRREAIRAGEETIRALEALVQHFEKQCRQDVTETDEYLAKTGVVHDAVMKAETLSRDETEAITRAWKLNGESLEDSLQEVKAMMEKNDENPEDGGSDGWDEIGEEFGRELNPEEMQRVKQVYPLLRFTTLLHEKILSHHILKPPTSQPYAESHLRSLVTYSNSLHLVNDDLASSLYAPQDVEGIKEAARLVHELTQDLNRELGVTEASIDKIAEELAGVQLGSGSQSLTWFRKCFSQINTVYNALDLGK